MSKKVSLCSFVKPKLLVLIAVLFILSIVPEAWAQQAVDIEWTRQYGGTPSFSEFDFGHSVDSNSGDTYVSGYTGGAFSGEIAQGAGDGYVRKYDNLGNHIWTRQYGTAVYDDAPAVSVYSSTIYVTGYTDGAFTGETAQGGGDSYVRKYDQNGNHLWTKQFGTSDYDEPTAIIADSGGIYVAGYTYSNFPGETNSGDADYFIRKYDSNGNHIWTKQYGTTLFDYTTGISIYNNNIYISGYTDGTFPGETAYGAGDPFIAKYDTDGTRIWLKQFGTSSNDKATGISSSATGIYIGGHTQGTFSGETYLGEIDAFVAKYDTDGNQQWLKEFGTSSQEISFSVNAGNNVYITGLTRGTFPSQVSFGDADVFIQKYDKDGILQWSKQFGTSFYDRAFSISRYYNDLYVSGDTKGTFSGQTSSGGTDAFVVKLTQDSDGDGIFDGVDTQPAIFSNDFSDGTTTGTITNRVDQTITITDAADPIYGVSIVASGGTTPAEVSACDGTSVFSLNAGDEILVTCGNVTSTEPITSDVVAAPNPVAVNTLIILTANVDDSATGGSTVASAEFSIDDPNFTTKVPMTAADGTFNGISERVTGNIVSLRFTTAGVHEICVRGKDVQGNVGRAECILLAVYDPEGGFVTGGGWINSPREAYTADPTLTGKATFGFVSKYKNGATTPTGETEFQFKAPDLNFHSNAYDWLVIAGARAQYKGSGTINNAGDYGFMLTGIDEALTPSTDVDLFRIKIWDKNDGDTIVYDNQAGVGDDADPTTVLGGGNIVIHKGNKKDVSRIAFQTDRDGNNEIYVMNPDGTTPTNVTNNPAAEQSPAWSPDGSHISFVSFRDGNGEIYVMGADGSGQTNLTNNPGGDQRSTWSPDGSKIGFASFRPPGSAGTHDVYVMNSDGTNQVNITNTALNVEARNPDWSPDGTKIAFDFNPSGGQTHDVYGMNPDGSNQTRLTTDPERDQFPAWSPDGTKIAFASHRDGNYEIYVMNADGSSQIRLTNSLGSDVTPTWSPDGTKIAFQTDRDGNPEVYVMNADGSNQTNVTNNPAEDGSPAWSPK